MADQRNKKDNRQECLPNWLNMAKRLYQCSAKTGKKESEDKLDECGAEGDLNALVTD